MFSNRLKKSFFKTDILFQFNRNDILAKQQFVLFRIFSFTGTVVALVAFFQLTSGVQQAGLFHYMILLTSVILFVNFLLVTSIKKIKRAYLISLLTAFALLHVVMYKSGGIRTSGSVYFAIVIMYAFALLGERAGKYFTAAAIIHIAYVFIISNTTHWTNFEMMDNKIELINRDFLVNFILLFLLVAFVHGYLQSGKNVVIKNISKSRDESERKNKLLIEYNKTLKETNNELEKFANVMSHDLKAPLRAIGSLTDIVKDDLRTHLNDEHISYFAIIKGRVQRMENLINGLLQYTKSGREKEIIEQVDTGLLIHEVKSKLNVPSNCIISINGIMPLIKTEKIKLQQVFAELISNSIVHSDKEQISICISAAEENDCWKFKVADNGPGIEEKFFEKVFVIFQTLKPRDSFESRGIGLSIAKRIVTGLGGTISVQSTPGNGCTFTFSIAKETNNIARQTVRKEIEEG